MNPRLRVAVVGPGRVGSTLARALSAAGHEIVALIDKGHDPGPISGAEVVLLTVPDDDIAPVFRALAGTGALRASQIAIHCSGLVGSGALAAPGLVPAGRASMHPMLPFADKDRAIEMLPGTTYGIEGDERGSATARGLVEDLGGVCVTVPPEAKAAYHLACVMASNGLVALTDMAEGIARSAGVSGDGVGQGLAHLVAATARNMALLGVRPAMTGPAVRGDAATVERHLALLATEADPLLRQSYTVLTRRLVEMARAEGRGDALRYGMILEMLDSL